MTDGRQNLLSLTYVPDYVPKKELKVSKEWKGLSPEFIEKLPEVTVSVLQNDVEITTLKLNKDNNWQATCKVEDNKDNVYTIKEVSENNNILNHDNKYYGVEITGDVDTGFVIVNTLKTYDISIKKVDDKKVLLEGATLKLIKGEDSNGTEIVKEWTSTKVSEVLKLESGIYTLVEVSAPSGYKLSSPITFKVTEAGKLEINNSGVYTEQTGLEVEMIDEKDISTGGSSSSCGNSSTGGSSSSGGSSSTGENLSKDGSSSSDKKTEKPVDSVKDKPSKVESDKNKKPSKPDVVNGSDNNKNISNIDKNKKDDIPKKKTDSSKISYKEDSDNIDITASSSSSEQNFDPGVRKPEDKDKNSKVVKTSDSTKVVFYSSMVLISSLVIGFYIFDKKKK